MHPAFTVVPIVFGGLYIVAICASLPRSRWQIRLKQAAIAFAAAAVLTYVVKAIVGGPNYLVYGGIWVGNLALAAVGLYIVRRTARRSRI